MLIHYDLVQKQGDIFKRDRVLSVSMLTVDAIQQVYATVFNGAEKDGEKLKDTVKVDEVNAWLFQSTNSFDKNGKLIFHGHILKDKDGTLYEVFYANGAYFIVKDDAPLMLLDQHTSQLEVVGDVVQDYKLVQTVIDETIFTQPN